MKHGKTIGEYLWFLLREGIFRLRRELVTVRGLIALFIVAYLVLDTWLLAESESTYMMQGFGVWLVLLFPPRMGRLFFLLPFSKQERKRYFFTYAAVYLFYFILVYLLIGGIAFLITGYPYRLWMKWFVLCTMPFLLMIITSMVSGAFFKNGSTDNAFYRAFTTRGWYSNGSGPDIEGIREEYGRLSKKKRSELTEEELREQKSRKKRMVLEVAVAVGVSVHCFGGWYYGLVSEKVFLICSVAAYCLAGAGVALTCDDAMKAIFKTGKAGKEEGCKCNL